MAHPGPQPIDAGLSAPVRRLARGLNAALAAAWAGFLVAILLGAASPVPVASLTDWMVVVPAVGAAASSDLRVALVREQRAVWAPLALGPTSYGVGAFLWTTARTASTRPRSRSPRPLSPWRWCAELTTSQRTALIVSSPIQLAQRLGLHAVAEASRTTRPGRRRPLGCPAVQGYVVAKPMPGAQLREWAAKRPANRIPTASTRAAPVSALAESGAPLARNDTTPGA